jgi:hypothetical protein
MHRPTQALFVHSVDITNLGASSFVPSQFTQARQILFNIGVTKFSLALKSQGTVHPTT